MKDDHVATLPLVHWPAPGRPAGIGDFRRAAATRPSWPAGSRWAITSASPTAPTRSSAPSRTTTSPRISPRPSPAATPPRSPAAPPTPGSAPGSTPAGPPRARRRAWAGTPSRNPRMLRRPARSRSPGDRAGTTRPPRGSRPSRPTGRGALARRILGGATAGRPGFLILNPVGRRPPRGGGAARRRGRPPPGRAAQGGQLTEDGVMAVVELAAFGFAWVPRDSDPTSPRAGAGAPLTVRDDRSATNRSRSSSTPPPAASARLKRPASRSARLGQQLVIDRPVDPDGPPRRRDAGRLGRGRLRRPRPGPGHLAGAT